MLTLRPELSNLDACEVRETPLTWWSTTGALAYLSLFIIVRRAKAKWPRPQGPVAWLSKHHVNCEETVKVCTSQHKYLYSRHDCHAGTRCRVYTLHQHVTASLTISHALSCCYQLHWTIIMLPGKQVHAVCDSQALFTGLSTGVEVILPAVDAAWAVNRAANL